MIRVTLELLPSGIESRARTIGLMEITNVKTYADNTADYACVLKKTPPFNGALKAAWQKAIVKSADGLISQCIASEDEPLISALVTGHHRERRGVYDLLFRALKACGHDRRNA